MQMTRVTPVALYTTADAQCDKLVVGRTNLATLATVDVP